MATAEGEHTSVDLQLVQTVLFFVFLFRTVPRILRVKFGWRQRYCVLIADDLQSGDVMHHRQRAASEGRTRQRCCLPKRDLQCRKPSPNVGST